MNLQVVELHNFRRVVTRRDLPSEHGAFWLHGLILTRAHMYAAHKNILKYWWRDQKSGKPQTEQSGFGGVVRHLCTLTKVSNHLACFSTQSRARRSCVA